MKYVVGSDLPSLDLRDSSFPSLPKDGAAPADKFGQSIEWLISTVKSSTCPSFRWRLAQHLKPGEVVPPNAAP